jgi:hypothetical protein
MAGRYITIERLGARGRGNRQGSIDLEALQGVQMESARWGRGKNLLTFFSLSETLSAAVAMDFSKILAAESDTEAFW